MNNILIQIASRDRPTEVALLLQSLRTQTYKQFNVIILDDGSKTPLANFYFIQYLIQRMTFEGNEVVIIRNDIPSGVSKARQFLVDWTLKNKRKEELLCRLDDDVIIERDYIQKLMEVIDKGYDIASGLTTPLSQPEWVRDVKYVSPVIGYCEFDNEGKLKFSGDDCGYGYDKPEILLSPHFRSCALYKKKIHEEGVDYDSRLSKNGFREEHIISFKAILKGFKIGVHTQANALHLMTPSGGERDTMNMQEFNQKIFEETIKRMFDEHGDFLTKYYKDNGIDIEQLKRSNMEYHKVSNLCNYKPYVMPEEII